MLSWPSGVPELVLRDRSYLVAKERLIGRAGKQPPRNGAQA
jgi:hypothetical protein